MRTAQQIFDKNSMPEPNSGCWFWLPVPSKRGYGIARIGGRAGVTMTAHRLSWKLHRGDIPDGMSVLHRCDVRCCVNPDHLFLGTKVDNMADMVAKNRQSRGEKRPLARLTEKQVRSILADKRSRRLVAATYGVTQWAISDIRRGKNWSYLTREKGA